MIKLGRTLTLGVLIMGFAGGFAFAGGSQETEPTGEIDYSGKTLNVALVSGFTESEPILAALEAAANELGSEVQASWYSNDELNDKILLDFRGNNTVWDITMVHSPSRGGWAEAGIIIPIEKWAEEHPDQVNEGRLGKEDYSESAVENYTHDGQWIGPPLFETGVAMFYRTDLFEHPEEQENFRNQYGYDLQVPQTYEQFRDVAEFFTREAGETLAGETLQSDFYGTSHSNKPTGFLWFDFMNYLMAFGGDNIYDPDTMQPTFDSPEAIAAGEYYVDLVPFLPPGHQNMASGQSTAMFAEGSVAMIIEFFLRGLQMAVNPEQSKVSDRVDFSILPSRRGVQGREHAAQKGGNMVAIYGLSQNKATAYKVLELAFSPGIMKQVFLEEYAPYGWIPPRLSVLEDPEVQAAAPWAPDALEMISNPDIFYYDVPALPEYFQAMDIAATALSRALAGQESVEQAFGQAQEELLDYFEEAGLSQ